MVFYSYYGNAQITSNMKRYKSYFKFSIEQVLSSLLSKTSFRKQAKLETTSPEKSVCSKTYCRKESKSLPIEVESKNTDWVPKRKQFRNAIRKESERMGWGPTQKRRIHRRMLLLFCWFFNNVNLYIFILISHVSKAGEGCCIFDGRRRQNYNHRASSMP